MSMPNFVKAGSQGETFLNKGKFIKLESGKTIEIIPLTGVEPPPGKKPDGTNCVISFQQYTMWLDDLPEGKLSPIFPALGGKDDPGALLNLQPKFRAMMLVMTPGEEEEQIFAFGIQIFKQLVEIEQALGTPLRGHVLKVTRTGSGLGTKYRVVPTAKTVDIEGEPETNLLDHIGPTTREGIIAMLEEAGVWPPVGGDPFANGVEKKPKLKLENQTEKPGPSENKLKRKPVIEPEPEENDDSDDDWDDEEFESVDED